MSNSSSVQFDHMQLDHVFIALFNVQVYFWSFWIKKGKSKWNSNESDSHSPSDNYESDDLLANPVRYSMQQDQIKN